MFMLKCWTRSALLLLALTQAVHAETTVSQSNDTNAGLGVSLSALFGRERQAMQDVARGRLTDLNQPVQKTKGKKADKIAMTYDAAWINALPAAKPSEELDCLARAIYFESRGEPIKGQAAVAEVVMNRTESPYFPQSICGVVRQSNAGGCQFSFICDGYSDKIRDQTAWYVAEKLASAFIAGAPRELTDGATYFHTPAVKPAWAKRFPMTVKIGSHYFYRQPIQTAMN
ncbi:MAG: cell wall hydrolase [Paracoccaceae bacterium]